MKSKSPGITLCLLTRDSEKHLRERLSSLFHHFDRVIVMDTGSQDGTLEYLRTLDCEVFQLTWRDDFSWARNQALDLVNTEWVFFPDSDEWMTPQDLESLKARLQTLPESVWGVTLPIALYQDNPRKLDFTEARLDPRLDSRQRGAVFHRRLICFRSLPRIGYRGIVHESVFKGIVESGKEIIELPCVVHNYGYRQSEALVSETSKSQWYHRLLLRQVGLTPREPKPLFELGVSYLESGDELRALSCLRSVVRLKPNFFEAWYLLGKIQGRLGKWDTALKSLGLASADPHWKGLALFQMGTLYQERKLWDDALNCYESSFNLLPNPMAVGWAVLRLADEKSDFLLGLQWVERMLLIQGADRALYFYQGVFRTRLKRFQEAGASFRKAIEQDPRHLPSQFNLASVLAVCGDFREALTWIRNILKWDPQHEGARRLCRDLLGTPLQTATQGS